MKDSNNNYSLSRTVTLQNDSASSVIDEILMVTFLDLDNSGSIDLMFFFKANGKFYYKGLFNPFVPQEVCGVSGQGVFPYSNLDVLSLDDFQIPTNYQIFEDSIPHFNDVNADGLPDILTMMEMNGYTKVILLIN